VNDIQPECVVCGRRAPPTDTNYTLISQRHGWRLVIEKTAEGRRASVWYCAECWSVRKNTGATLVPQATKAGNRR
jgi:hypothetical protein